MKKLVMILVLLLGIGGLSLTATAQSYSGTVTASTTVISSNHVGIDASWNIFGGATFNAALGDSVSIFFELTDSTLDQIIGSQYIHHVTSAGDSVNSGIAYTLTGLTAGHIYKVAPHLLLYQHSTPVWFTNGTTLVFTTTCTAPNTTVTPISSTICSGSSVTLSATGAATYSWSPAAGLSETTGASVVASPTATTTYVVTGSNGICTATSSTTITVSGIINLSLTPTTATICSGTSVTCNASGATTYSWSPSTGLSVTTGASVVATPEATITYTVQGTNGSCTASKSVAITVAGQMDLSVSGSAKICDGSSTQLNASGATTYSWSPVAGLDDPNIASPTATPTATTTYVVTGSNGACSETASVTITVMALPSVTSGQYNSNTLVLNGIFPGGISTISINGTVYTPFVGNDVQAIFNGVNNLQNGNIVYVTTISSNCFTLWIYDNTGLETFGSKDVKVYPNPFSETLSVELPDGNYRVELYDMLGKRIFQELVQKNFVIQRDGLPQGMYVLDITKLNTTGGSVTIRNKIQIVD